MAEIYTKMPLIMGDIGAIGKTRKNAQQGYVFRGIDDVYLAVHSVLSEHGVFCVPQVLDMKREERASKNGGVLFWTILTVKYTFFAPDGSFVDAITVGEAMDSGDKSCNKAMSTAQKYAFWQIFCIPTEEPKDTEIDTYEVSCEQDAKECFVSDAEVEALYLLAKNSKHTNASIKKYILNIYGINSIKELPQNKLDDFITWLTQKGTS